MTTSSSSSSARGRRTRGSSSATSSSDRSRSASRWASSSGYRRSRICPGASTTLPFYKYVLVVPVFAWLYVPWVAFVLTGTSNAVNLTDGLDGLATGLAAIAFATFAIFAYLIGRFDASQYLHIYYLRDSGELTVFCMSPPRRAHRLSLVQHAPGRSLHGRYRLARARRCARRRGDPAQIGISAAAGRRGVRGRNGVGDRAALACSSIGARRYGVDYAKAHRVFLRAPLHHHFELKGWQESQVVVRFWILGILSALVALSTLKLR